MEKLFLLRDDQGRVYNEVARPAVLFDTKFSILLKIGEFEDMITELSQLNISYRNAGLTNNAEKLAVMDLPHDQNEIDKVMTFTGYVGILYAKVMSSK